MDIWIIRMNKVGILFFLVGMNFLDGEYALVSFLCVMFGAFLFLLDNK